MIDSKKIHFKLEGTYLSLFKEVSGKLGIISLNAEEDCQVTCKSSYPMIVYSRNFSDISVKLLNTKKNFEISTSNILIVQKNETIVLSKISPSWQFSILFVSSENLNNTINTYSIDKKNISKIFNTDRLLGRKNWINEILHRYYFARSVEKIDNNFAASFLELEIIKEIYYSYIASKDIEQRDIFIIDDYKLSLQNPILEQTVTFIEKNLFQNITVKSLGQEVNVSTRTLNRLFKNCFNRSPGKYIQHRRLQEAHLMLRSTNYSVSEIAEIIGYDSLSSFIHAFKSKFHDTPLKIATRYRNNDK